MIRLTAITRYSSIYYTIYCACIDAHSSSANYPTALPIETHRQPEPLACCPLDQTPIFLPLRPRSGEGDETKFVVELQIGSHGTFYHAAGSHPVRFLANLSPGVFVKCLTSSDCSIESPINISGSVRIVLTASGRIATGGLCHETRLSASVVQHGRTTRSSPYSSLICEQAEHVL
jgi:hypothetical protein